MQTANVPKTKKRKYTKTYKTNGKPFTKAQYDAIKKITQQDLEKKHHDTQIAINISNATFATDILDPPQNTTDTGRIGDQIRIESVSCSLRLAHTINATMRVMVVQWHDNTADNNINATDMFQFALTGAVFDANTINNIYNIDQTPKFTVLYDKKHTFNPNYSAGLISKTLNLYFDKGFRKQVKFNEAVLSGVNKMFLLLFSDIATVGAVNGYCRVRYYDG